MNTQTFKSILLGCFILSIGFIACLKKEQEEYKNDSGYIFPIPAHFPAPVLNPDNSMTHAGIALGRYLYYDTLLSLGGPRTGLACASCHFQEKGFTLPSQPVLAHVNLAWNTNFLWRGNISGTLEDIMLFEVNEFFASDLQGIRNNLKYSERYKAAFGSAAITDTTTAYALAQFIRTLVSGNALYDQYLRKEKYLPEAAMRGMQLFYSEKGDCFHCHSNALFTDNAFHNTGLAVKNYGDLGRYTVTGSSSDVGKFKTPSLRNTALRAAYMHDGRYTTLKQAVEHYRSGVKFNDNLDPLLDRPSQGLSEQDIDDLVAFLETLTDAEFLSNKQLSKPE